MPDHVNLIKLCVGTGSPDELAHWQMSRRKERPDKFACHVTRMWPRRAGELLEGGSLYWVMKGVTQARQRIIRLDEVVGSDGILRCGIILDPEIVRTAPVPRRPFQGWRYLNPEDAPPDLAHGVNPEDPIPASLNAALAEIGVL